MPATDASSPSRRRPSTSTAGSISRRRSAASSRSIRRLVRRSGRSIPVSIERGRYSEVTSRGVSTWRDGQRVGCARAAAASSSGRSTPGCIALDAGTGSPLCGLRKQGRDRSRRRLSVKRGDGNYQVTSPPAILRDLVIVGSSIGDNWNADTGSGVVRAFDARTGVQRWAWHPLADVAGRAAPARQCVVDDLGGRRTRPRVRPDHAARARISTADFVPATIATRTRSSRFAARRASSCGRSRPCTTTSGTTTSPLSRRWSP